MFGHQQVRAQVFNSEQQSKLIRLGGWWTRPSNWAANTAIASIGIIALTYGIWRVSASLEVCFEQFLHMSKMFMPFKRRDRYHPLDRYLQCWCVLLLFCCYFRCCWAKAVSCLVGERVYRGRKEIECSIDRYALIHHLYLVFPRMANLFRRMIMGLFAQNKSFSTCASLLMHHPRPYTSISIKPRHV